MTARAFGAALAPILALAGCATSSEVVTGSPREPLTAADVRVYTQTPPRHFEEIAVLRASRKSVAAVGERAVDRMIETMKAQAAKLGANGVLLEELTDSNPIVVGTGVGTQTYTHNGSIDLGVGGFFGLVTKTVGGRAIFVEPR